MHHYLCHLQIIPKIQSAVILHTWVPQACLTGTRNQSCVSQCVLPSNTSTSGPHHPPSLSSRSYSVTLNLDPLSVFCPGNKSLLFFLLCWIHGSPWLTPIKFAVSSNKYVMQGDRQVCPLTLPTLESHFTAACITSAWLCRTLGQSQHTGLTV